MSQLTATLMGERKARRAAALPNKLRVVADRLVSHYGTPTLGNFRDPVKEIFYIVLSARTTEPLYQRAHSSLFRRYPRIDLLAAADVADVLVCVKGAGLGTKRAVQVVEIAKQLTLELGKNPQRRLRGMTAAQVYAYLTALPGVGPKSAFCVMMCSLGHDVFPVDINVQRVLERLGALPKGLRHYEAQRLAPKYVPAGRSKELHVGLVEHGRKICVPIRPKCDACFLTDLCKHGIAAPRGRAKVAG